MDKYLNKGRAPFESAGKFLPNRNESSTSTSFTSYRGQSLVTSTATSRKELDDGGASGATQEKLLALIQRLNQALGLPKSRATDGVAKASAQMLSKMISNYEVTRVSIQQSQRTISRFSPNWEAFQEKYSDLKEDLGDSGGQLDRYLAVVARILSDEDLSQLLSKSITEDSTSASVENTPTKGRRGPVSSAPGFEGAGGQAEESNKENRKEFVPLEANEMSPLSQRIESYHDRIHQKAPNGPGLFESSPHRTNNNARQRLHMDEISGALNTVRKDVSVSRASALGDRDNVESTSASGNVESESLAILASAVHTARAKAKAYGHKLNMVDNDNAYKDVNNPEMPQWVNVHPMSYSGQTQESLLKSGMEVAVHDGRDASALEVELQELLLIDDLLYVFLGAKGRFINEKYVQHSSSIEFEVDNSMDPSLILLASNFLPICVSLQVLQVYLETRFEYKYGLVNHALAAMVKELVWEWKLLVSQLESMLHNGKLSLHSMWYYCQPSVGVLVTVSEVVTNIINNDLRGATVLNVLHECLESNKGDSNKYNTILALMKAASAPYLQMLEKWLYEGEVLDPYCEFLVIQKSDVQKESLTESMVSSYWEECYTLGREIPYILKDHTDMILRTGKYLNVVKQCQNKKSFKKIEHSKLSFDPESQNLSTFIERTFNYSSKLLLSVLYDEVDMMGRLQSLKRYFLLDQGDFLMHFIDSASEELEKTFDEISIRRLQSLFELAIKTSTSAADMYNEDAFCTISNLSVGKVLSGFYNNPHKHVEDGLNLEEPKDGVHHFRIDYKVSWPFSLVVTRKTLIKYQAIFSNLFQFKFVERKLTEAWQSQQLLRKKRVNERQNGLHEYLLCQEMLHFVHNYLTFMTFETIEPRWRGLESKLKTASTIDEVIEYHEKFLDSIMSSCCLLDLKSFSVIRDIKSKCMEFAHHILSKEGASQQRMHNIEREFEKSLKELVGLNLEISFLD